MDMVASADFYMTYRDLFQGCERSVVRFFCRRITCSCLDEKVVAVHPQPKTGLCDHCDSRIKQKDLWKCTGCNAFQYCSKKCQKASWPSHKEICKLHQKVIQVVPVSPHYIWGSAAAFAYDCIFVIVFILLLVLAYFHYNTLWACFGFLVVLNKVTDCIIAKYGN